VIHITIAGLEKPVARVYGDYVVASLPTMTKAKISFKLG
jgi:hypothetical protein